MGEAKRRVRFGDALGTADADPALVRRSAEASSFLAGCYEEIGRRWGHDAALNALQTVFLNAGLRFYGRGQVERSLRSMLRNLPEVERVLCLVASGAAGSA